MSSKVKKKEEKKRKINNFNPFFLIDNNSFMNAVAPSPSGDKFK